MRVFQFLAVYVVSLAILVLTGTAIIAHAWGEALTLSATVVVFGFIMWRMPTP